MAAPKGNQYAKGSKTNGRPSLYKPEYCEQVIEEMARGKSLTAFAASIDVSRQTVSEWMAQHEDFSVAVKRAKAKCAAWWEDRGRDLAEKGGAPGQATSVIFGLKNMASEDWADIKENRNVDKDRNDVPAVAIYQLPDNGRSNPETD